MRKLESFFEGELVGEISFEEQRPYCCFRNDILIFEIMAGDSQQVLVHVQSIAELPDISILREKPKLILLLPFSLMIDHNRHT